MADLDMVKILINVCTCLELCHSALHFCTLEETKEGGLSKLNELDVLFCGILLVHI